jgi:hypothetical protein
MSTEMHEGIAVEIVASIHALNRPRFPSTARLWVGETEEDQIQIAFDPPGDSIRPGRLRGEVG